MGTLGLLSITRGEKVAMKIVTGADGARIHDLAKDIRSSRVLPDLKSAVELCRVYGLDGPSVIVQIPGMAWRVEDNNQCDVSDIGERYNSTFHIPNFNPRWDCGLSDHYVNIKFPPIMTPSLDQGPEATGAWSLSILCHRLKSWMVACQSEVSEKDRIEVQRLVDATAEFVQRADSAFAQCRGNTLPDGYIVGDFCRFTHPTATGGPLGFAKRLTGKIVDYDKSSNIVRIEHRGTIIEQQMHTELGGISGVCREDIEEELTVYFNACRSAMESLEAGNPDQLAESYLEQARIAWSELGLEEESKTDRSVEMSMEEWLTGHASKGLSRKASQVAEDLDNLALI